MEYAYFALRAVHLIFMGSWFGATLMFPGDLRRSLTDNRADLGLTYERAKRVGTVATVFGWGTFLSGVALIVWLGGMGAVPVPVHIGLTLTLVMIGVGWLGIGRTVTQMGALIADGASREALSPLARRVSMLSGIFQLLWLMNLLLMVFRNVLM